MLAQGTRSQYLKQSPNLGIFPALTKPDLLSHKQKELVERKSQIIFQSIEITSDCQDNNRIKQSA